MRIGNIYLSHCFLFFFISVLRVSAAVCEIEFRNNRKARIHVNRKNSYVHVNGWIVIKNKCLQWIFGVWYFFFLFILAHKRVTNTHSVSGLHKYKHNGFNVDFRLRENERIPRQSAIIFDFIATVNPIARACIFFTFYILSIGHEFGTEFFIMLVYIFFFHLLLFVSFDRAQRNVSKYGNLQMFQTTHGPFTMAPNK